MPKQSDLMVITKAKDLCSYVMKSRKNLCNSLCKKNTLDGRLLRNPCFH